MRKKVTAETLAPVLVVGAGPAGAVLALELAHHGVRSILIDQFVGPSPHPKMDFLNGRSMELLRRLQLVDEIRERGVGAEHAFTFQWSTTFAEPPVTTWDYYSVREMRQAIAEVNDGSAPLEPYQRLQGSLLEDILLRRARENPLIDLREGWTFTGLTQHPDDTITARSINPDTDREEDIRSRYLVGCDGGNSAVRASLDVGMDTVGPEAQHCDVYFRSSDPALRRHGRFFLAIVASGLTVVSRDEGDTWTGTFPLPDEQIPLDDPMEEVRQRLGIELSVDDVLNVSYWQGRLAVAETYRQGHVFLAGDSAHQFYPTGGHGANTGIADGVDLGWKLAAVSAGWGGAELLASYEAERRPVALFNREMCFNLLEVWRRFPQLAADGATRAHLAGFLEQDSYQIDNIGIHFGYRYSASPVSWHEDGPAPGWQWRRIIPTTWPGGRAPSVRLADGSELFDEFGAEFTLVDLSGDNSGKALADAANRSGLPTSYLSVDDDQVRRAWERNLVLLRPDQHVAWRGDHPPENWDAVISRVRGK